MKQIVFFDFEVSKSGKILDIGAVNQNGATFHSSILGDFIEFFSSADYLCGHNIFAHDLKYIRTFLKKPYTFIDTLYLSPILFPERPYHCLIKDEKIISDQLNNPLSDAQKAKKLFEDQTIAFNSLLEKEKRAYYDLLKNDSRFNGFFTFIDYSSSRLSYLFNSKGDNITELVKSKICINSEVSKIADNHPIEFAYALAIIRTDDRYSITPRWVSHEFPLVENILYLMKGKNCHDSNCPYCNEYFNSTKMLKRWFGYNEFRKFNGEALQENAVNAAINGKSILAIFPTGGGKSLTFQLPALIAGEVTKSLTVVISPLQSLMKDQVENLEKRGIAEAVYINGLLSPLERSKAFERIISGEVSLLYIAPEQLRSKTLERALLSRNINRFVIDEAHCFSAWGQDFRIEYQYIGDFLSNFQKKKGLDKAIPVSCFTATARPKVISDIIDYFDKHNGISLERFTTAATRTNLSYTVLHRDSRQEKYQTLRSLLQTKECPAIIYVARTKSAEDIAKQLCEDGLNAKAFHGQMDTITKIRNQEDFVNNKTRIIVATSAFGMGVDKSDVGLVVHFDISDSLENYLQEAGRAGRDVNSQAECYVLYNDNDLNKHFIMLNQTKLTLSEINQIWKAIKALTKNRNTIYISSLEVARKAGWEEVKDIETKVKSAIFALECAGYVKRGMNSPRIFATSIIPHNFESASNIIDSSTEINEENKVICKRIIKSLISEKRRSMASTHDGESRVDYLSDMLGIETSKVIFAIETLRNMNILAKDNDMTAYLRKKLINELGHYAKLESLLLSYVNQNGSEVDLKIFNEFAIDNGIKKSKIKDIKTLVFFWQIQEYINKTIRLNDSEKIKIAFNHPCTILQEKQNRRISLCNFILTEMEKMENLTPDMDYATVNFSLTSLMESYARYGLLYHKDISIEEIQEALLFLAKTGIVSIEGGFMVIYNKLQIERTAENNLRYKKEDYKNLDLFYKQKIQQIHIVGEFANMIVKDYNKAMEFVKDYFLLDYKSFIKRYFDSNREKEINLNISPQKYKEIFGSLTETQSKVISDKESKFIVVPAGPGSGKTYILVRKLASLLLMEDIKAEKLLMLTFSRAAASEFKQRLRDLIGNAAKYVEIKTFHSYCFDILGQRGTLEKSEDIVKLATKDILDNKVEISRITKSIVVIDEAQDMSAEEFGLIEALIAKNEDVRVIAVGDDDQNIYAFRGSDSKYFKTLLTKYNAAKYDMLDNFRSSRRIIACANDFVQCIPNRLKNAPIKSNRRSNGEVKFIQHKFDNYEEAIVSEIISNHHEGSTCVLTLRNEDALIINSLLNLKGKKAHLIQSNDGFSLSNLAELYFFLNEVKSKCSTTISNTVWENAKHKMICAYERSKDLHIAINCINSFYQEYETRYLSDLENFVYESNLADFDEHVSNEIVVSTIHKAKGHEYENVYISLKGLKYISEEEKRAIYVGLTRAKYRLIVHSNIDLSEYINFVSANFQICQEQYNEPEELLIQLNHKDVVLDFFKGRLNVTSSLYSGQEVMVRDSYIEVENSNRAYNILKFSEAFRKRLIQMAENGYIPDRAYIRHIVYWKYEEINDNRSSFKEIPIVLPDIYFRKK